MTRLCIAAAQTDELADVHAQRLESFSAAVEKRRQLL
jgi:hypothetical protein